MAWLVALDWDRESGSLHGMCDSHVSQGPALGLATATGKDPRHCRSASQKLQTGRHETLGSPVRTAYA